MFNSAWGTYCQEREKEEDYEPGILTRLADANIVITKGLQRKIERVEKEKSKLLEIKVYDMIPRFNIYIVNDTLMTVQGYACQRPHA
jgi:hypothetical protein